MTSGPGTSSSTYAITTIKILVAQPITRMAVLLSVWDAHPSMREEVARRLLASSGATRERRGCLVVSCGEVVVGFPLKLGLSTRCPARLTPLLTMKHIFRSASLGLMILFTSGFAEQFCWPEEYEHGCSSDQNIAFGDRAYVHRMTFVDPMRTDGVVHRGY
ncbi:hypothetical protein PGT21_022503 [Puccinia graminis f. sp. tritici]|uniref:Uncharacterized protein n=1 Tax=Puccinia graminis f. sp. tritici TaxID=56615 RepID=A0A5B0M512_PUCGR|nr:hypothetical protein PGT21_022503 [Puccinia graminis f. sp. tritici]